MEDIGEVIYYRCTNCGFTISKTHCELDNYKWEKLNSDFHHFIEREYVRVQMQSHQPPYLQQALMIAVLSSNGIINSKNMLDYAGGYGTLSNILKKYFNINLPIYDPYIHQNDTNLYITKDLLKKYKVVINSAMFEHITTRTILDEINNCVEEDGCLIIHTVICENIPKDPNWFYLKPPVHCAFHTNKSMEILMQQWNYQASVYCPTSKCWVLFKKRRSDIQKKINAINQAFQNDYFYYKDGFVDYWKGF